MPVAIEKLARGVFDEGREPTSTGSSLASWIKTIENAEQVERDDAQRYLDWYFRKRVEIIDALKVSAALTFSDVTEWQWPIINGVRRTVSRISTTYKTSPVREYLTAAEKPVDDKTADAIALMYSQCPRDVRLKKADRMATLLNTIHVEVVFRKGFIDWDIHLRPNSVVVADPEDPFALYKFAYSATFTNPDTLDDLEGWIYWSPSRHVFISEAGVEVPWSDNGMGLNPYKDAAGNPIIPVTTVRKIEEDGDYWGRFGADLVDATQAANLLLANVWETAHLQSHGQPFMVNVETEDGKEVAVGAKHAVSVKNATKDEHPPTFEFVDPGANYNEARELIDWFIKMNGASYSQPPSAWALEETRLSGFAKFMDNIELMETREEQITEALIQEEQLWQHSRMVHNHWNEKNKIPEDVIQVVTFPEAQIPESPTEKAEREAVEVANNVSSIVDQIMERYGIDDRKKAMKKAIEIARENLKVKQAAGMGLFEQEETEDDDEEKDKDPDAEPGESEE